MRNNLKKNLRNHNWTSAEKLEILWKMIETINFHSYEDESKTLLKEMGVNNDEDDDDDDDD